MDVSYSAWQNATEESTLLNGDSFSFLFDRRYANRLNRMSRVFFEAYAKATSELAAQEDRFPSLSEIDAKMVSGAVYAFKDRLMKNTQFFEEVKISGVSYLVPRARRFVDSTGTYTDLEFNFEQGTVTLPTRRKIPSPVDALPQEEVPKATSEPEAKEILEPEERIPEEAPKPLEVQPEAEQMARKEPEPYPEMEQEAAYEEPEPSPFIEPAPAPTPKEPEAKPEPPKIEHKPMPRQEIRAQNQPKGPLSGLRDARAVGIILVVAFAILTGIFVLPGLLPTGPESTPIYVQYSVALMNITQVAQASVNASGIDINETNITQADLGQANASKINYLELDIKNKEGISHEMEMELPQNIDQSISARGGIVTIAHTDKTFVRLNSSSDASIRIYLAKEWDSVPVVLNLVVPEGYDSSVVVHETNYDVTREDDRIVLRFNCTVEGTNFEQSYLKKR